MKARRKKEFGYDPKTRKITIGGKALQRLKRAAKRAGMSPEVLLNKRLRELMRDPELLNRLALESWLNSIPVHRRFYA